MPDIKLTDDELLEYLQTCARHEFNVCKLFKRGECSEFLHIEAMKRINELLSDCAGYKTVVDDLRTQLNAQLARLYSDEEETPKPSTRATILDTAKQTVCEDRQDQYGGVEDTFKSIAGLWAIYLRATCPEGAGYIYITPEDVAAMMALLKIARIATGSSKADNWVDLAGYAACGGELDG